MQFAPANLKVYYPEICHKNLVCLQVLREVQNPNRTNRQLQILHRMHSNTLPNQLFPDPHKWTRMQVLVNAGLTAQNVTCDAQCWKTGPVRPMFLECHDIVSKSPKRLCEALDS